MTTKTTITITNVLSLQSSCKKRRLHGKLHYKPSNILKPIVQQLPHVTPQHVLIMDTGGGTTPTITANAWKITHQYNVTMSMSGYQSKDPPMECAVVHYAKKAGRCDIS
jgi:hypothetical protein